MNKSRNSTYCWYTPESRWRPGEVGGDTWLVVCAEPPWGQHTEQILLEEWYTMEQISDLMDAMTDKRSANVDFRHHIDQL